MAVDDFLGKDWKDRTTGGKILYGALATTGGGIPILANEAAKMWKGDEERLSEIEKQAAELENSEFNTAKETQKMEDYYDQVFLNAAKAQREAEYGFSPEQKAEARQTFAEGSNLAMQNAQNAGGGTLQNYINANMNTNVNKFATGMASQDAALKMQKQQQVLNYLNQLGSAAGNSQDIFTQNFNKNIMAEQAIGQAEKDWYTGRDANRMALVNAGVSGVGQIAGAVATGGASAAMPTAAG
jgi:hypothetical protein